MGERQVEQASARGFDGCATAKILYNDSITERPAQHRTHLPVQQPPADRARRPAYVADLRRRPLTATSTLAGVSESRFTPSSRARLTRAFKAADGLRRPG